MIFRFQSKFIFIVFFIAAPLNTLILNCTFVDVAIRFRLQNVYSCQGEIIFVGDPRIVNQVLGSHSSGRSNNDVQSLEIVRQDVKILPRNIDSFFLNLESVYVHRSGLKEVSKEDFSGFLKLKQVDLHFNDVEEIDGNLLEGNPLVEAFSVFSNPIRHVGHNIFDHLPNLNSAHFVNGKCINERFDGNRTAVEEIMFKLTVNCPPTFEMIERRILSGNNLQTRENELKNQLQNELKTHLAISEKTLTTEMTENFDKIIAEMIKPADSLITLEKRLDLVERKLKNCVCVDKRF